MKTEKISAKIVVKTDLNFWRGLENQKMVFFKNGLFKPRLYGKNGKLLNQNSFRGLGITPQMDLL